MHQVYLSLGSNLGNKLENIKTAIAKIEHRLGRVTALSGMYATKPLGFESDNDFVNAACIVETRLEAIDILRLTQNIEQEMGREAKSKDQIYSDRIIDIDIVLFDSLVILSPQLNIPHPEMHRRMFVLAPMVDIAPDVIHPIIGKSMNELILNLQNDAK